MTEAELRGYEPQPGAQAYPAFVAWLALNGSLTDVVLAFLANLAIWGENCAKVAAALREAYGAGDDAVAFFDFFASPPTDFESRALAVLDEGLAAGDSPLLARRNDAALPRHIQPAPPGHTSRALTTDQAILRDRSPGSRQSGCALVVFCLPPGERRRRGASS
jgi:hypothetical protein